MEFLVASSVPKAQAAYRRAVENGDRTIDLELEMKRKDGSVFTGELKGRTSIMAAQHGSLVVIRDISQRKQAEEQLRFLSSITENTSEASSSPTLISPSPISTRSRKSFSATGLEELKGQTPEIFNAEPRAEEIQQKMYQTVAAGKTYLGESLNRRKDGSTFFCEYKVMPLKDGHGKIYAYSSVQRDISERKRNEEVLLRARKRSGARSPPSPTRPTSGPARPTAASCWASTTWRPSRSPGAGIKKYLGIEAEKLFAGNPDFVKKIAWP